MKRLFVVTGYPFSGIGKAVITASIASLFLKVGQSVRIIKFDGYLNYSLETMNPFHKPIRRIYRGEEVFVLKDGTLTDSDWGIYERFTNLELDSSSILTTSKIFKKLWELESKNSDGQILQYEPHVSNVMKNFIDSNEDNVILEVGGTLGDPENEKFLKLVSKIYPNAIPVALVACSTFLSEEPRIKPVRQATKLISEYFRTDPLIVVRIEDKISKEFFYGLFRSPNVKKDKLIICPVIENVYRIPNIIQPLLKRYGVNLKIKESNDRVLKKRVLIGVSKNTESFDTFLSLIEALKSAGKKLGFNVEISYDNDNEFWKSDGFVIAEQDSDVPRIKLFRRIEKTGKPFLGISSAFLEYSAWKKYCKLTNELLLGSYKIAKRKSERFRVRKYMFKKNIKFGERVENQPCRIDLKNGTLVSYHPEFNSKPQKPHPLFINLIKRISKSKKY